MIHDSRLFSRCGCWALPILPTIWSGRECREAICSGREGIWSRSSPGSEAPTFPQTVCAVCCWIGSASSVTGCLQSTTMIKGKFPHHSSLCLAISATTAFAVTSCPVILRFFFPETWTFFARCSFQVLVFSVIDTHFSRWSWAMPALHVILLVVTG